MSLSSCEVILDTYNLRLLKGSGIKTYGLTLIDGLRRLGATVSVLSDRILPRQRHALLDEVHFFDPPAVASALPRKLRLAADVLHLLSRPQHPVAVRMQNVLPSRSLRPMARADHIYNVAEIYDKAHRLHRLFMSSASVAMDTRRTPRPVPRRIWHATAPLPVRIPGVPMVTTIHDLIPLRLPYMTRDHKRTFYTTVGSSLRDSRLVFAVSEFTKRDLTGLFDIDPAKVVVTYQSYRRSRPIPEHVDHETILQQHGLRRQQYVLYVGNVDPRKNLGLLFQAVGTLPGDVPIVIAGRKQDDWHKELEAAQAYLGVYDRRRLRRRLRLLDYVPDPMLQVLYRNATCLVMPSLYEGFGLPVLEAMRHDCPVVCSDATSLPEIGGDAALYFDPRDAFQLGCHLRTVIEDPERRESMVRAGRERVALFSPERYAERLDAAYARVLAETA
jgi:glycosyltransferase involved in cell wall biosynthesis